MRLPVRFVSGKRVVIVGGGITGLSAAYYLERLAPKASITLLERSSTLGGKIKTIHRDGFLIEQGPDCFFTHKPWALDLIKELGIEDRLIAPKQSGFKMLVDGKLWPVARELVPLAYADLSAIDKAEFVSPEGRARAKKEPLQPTRTDTSDESIASFFRRRYGDEFSKKVVEPLLAGTHGAPAELLSMQALFPQYVQMEREHGSLTAAGNGKRQGLESNAGPLRSAKPNATSSLPEYASSRTVDMLPDPAPRVQAKHAAFLSFRNGMSELVEALSIALQGTQICTSQGVLWGNDRSVESRGGPVEFDELLLACSLGTTLLTLKAHTEAFETLRHFESTSAEITSIAFERSQVEGPLSATGFLVPLCEESKIKGSTWSSEKWENRAPIGQVLLRVFHSPYNTPEEAPSSASAVALKQLGNLMQITGAPTLVEITTGALPTYRVGHLERLAELNAALEKTPNIHLAGAAYGGVGIPDCIRQGKEAAEKIAASLSG